MRPGTVPSFAPSFVYASLSNAAFVAARNWPPVASAIAFSVAGSGRHRDRAGEGTEAARERPSRGPEREGVDGNPGLLRAVGPLERLQRAAGLRAVREEEDRDGRLGLYRGGDHVGDGLAGRLRRSLDRLLSELYRGGERVADRRAAEAGERPDVFEPLEHQLVVGRRRGRHLGLPGERDQADTQALRRVLEERARRLLGGLEPRRLDVGRLHRARDVDDEDDSGLILQHRRAHVRAREREAERGEREQEEDRRDVPAPGAAGHDPGEHVEVREPDRVAHPAALGEQPDPDRRGDCEQ